MSDSEFRAIIDAGMFASFPGFLFARKPVTINSGNGYTFASYLRIKDAVTPPVSRAPTQAEIDAVKAGLLSMIAQIEADRKARPVHAAIDATHRGFRSDGRPHHYHDPLLDD